MNLAALIVAAGDPLALASLWDPATTDQISTLVNTTISAAQRRCERPEDAVVATLMGMYAHAFTVGREHARLGLVMPGVTRQSLSGLTLQDISGFVIPDDIQGL